MSLFLALFDETQSAIALNLPTLKVDLLIHPLDGLVSIAATIDGPSEPIVLCGAHFVLHHIAAGKRAYVRVPPEATTQKDFTIGAVFHRGYVRFSFDPDSSGEWTYADPNRIHFGYRNFAKSMQGSLT